MAVAPINFGTPQISRDLDFSSLAQLPQVYRQAAADATRRDTLASLGQGGQVDPMRLIQSGDLNLANLGIGLMNRQQDAQRQADRDRILDARADREFNANQQYRNAQLSISRQNAENATDYTPAERAQMAGQYGIQPGSPEFKAFVLTGALPQGNTTVAQQTEQRRQAAETIGLTPDNPGYQSFVLTGKMPREDAQPLTATDKKAILEADEGVLSAKTAIEALQKAKELSPQAMGFKGAGNIAAIGSVFGNQTSEKTVELDNTVTSNALSQLKAIFGGAPTEGERKILLDIQGSSSQPDAVRQKIYDRAIQMATARLKFNEQRAAEMRGGQFYKPQGSMSRAPMQQTQGITQEQYNALPSGSVFTAPDGTQRVKP